MIPVRGQVFRADIGYGLKPWLVVSNNARNRTIHDVVAARITTTSRELPTWAALSHADPLAGYVNTDNLETLSRGELGEHLGTLTPDTMRRVDDALRVALGLT